MKPRDENTSPVNNVKRRRSRKIRILNNDNLSVVRFSIVIQYEWTTCLHTKEPVNVFFCYTFQLFSVFCSLTLSHPQKLYIIYEQTVFIGIFFSSLFFVFRKKMRPTESKENSIDIAQERQKIRHR